MSEPSAPTDTPKRSRLRSFVVHGAFIVVSALFLSLGIWQLNRAEEKRILLALEATAANAPAVPIDTVVEGIEEAAVRYARVTITGVWMPEKQLLWDNRVSSGKAGYEVITPLLTSTGAAVLVNRGWVPVGLSREQLPDVTAGVDDGASVSIQGVLSRPSKGLVSGPAVEPSTTWPKRAQYIDYAAFDEVVGREFVPALVQGRLLGESVTEAWHLVGNWEPTEEFGPSRHLGYAVQWFALFATLVFLYLWYEVRLFRAHKPDD